MKVRCPGCGVAIALAAGDARLACEACGITTPISRIGTEPGTGTPGALVALEPDLTHTPLAGRVIVERIGAGGMGTVYRARGEGGDVAIKVLRPGLELDRAAVLARFAREAEALRRLDHPRVVRLLDHGEDGAIAYIVTELVTGRDLAAILAEERPSLARTVELFAQVCDGVAAAHAAGIVHRDLKPANILVGEDGSAKVADFGLAQLGPAAAVTTLTRTDVAMGTFHYLAPEQRKDARTVDHRADVWALGVIFYEMLTGELPLGSFAPASTKGPPGCGRRVDAIVRRALAPDPGDRFASVAELGSAVRALIAPRFAARTWRAALALTVLAAGSAGAVGLHAASDDDRSPVTSARDATADPARDALVDGAPDALVDAAPDALVDAAPDAAIDAARVVDAGVVVRRPKPVRRPATTKPPVKKVDPVPRICRSAQRCCRAVKGSECNALLTLDADACEAAIVTFRERVTSAKQGYFCTKGVVR